MIYSSVLCIIRQIVFAQVIMQKWYILKYFVLWKTFFSSSYKLKVKCYSWFYVIKKIYTFQGII